MSTWLGPRAGPELNLHENITLCLSQAQILLSECDGGEKTKIFFLLINLFVQAI